MSARLMMWLRVVFVVAAPLAIISGVVWLIGVISHDQPFGPVHVHLRTPPPTLPVAKPQSPTVTQQPAAVHITPDYTIPPVVNGVAPVISRLPTKQPVVFLGIDDGINKESFELDLLQLNHIKASLFLADHLIRNNYDFFKPLVTEGSLIEDHTINHPDLTRLSYDQQKAEICDMADVEQRVYGRRPVLFRPPGGSYNLLTQKAAAACGMKAVVMWIAKANGGSMQFQIGHSLRPGDIVLMHFRPEFRQDFQAFLDAQNAAHLQTDLLENWLGPSN